MTNARVIEEQVFQRVVDALLREDHLGLATNGRRDGDHWHTHTGRAELRIPVRPDGFQHPWRTARPWLYVCGADGGPGRRVDTLDGLHDALAPVHDPLAEAGWATFAGECHGELTARRLAARGRSRVHRKVAAARTGRTTGMAGALFDDIIAAHADHPVHPTGHCRHGLREAELLAYAPEHAPTFPLRWLPTPRRRVTLTGALPPWWPTDPDPDTVLLPVHPLTADRLELPVVDTASPLVRPTLSMRTVALVDDPATHLKLPLATATLGARNGRLLDPGTLRDGAAVHRLLDRVAAGEPRFAGRILHADETTYGHAGDGSRAFLLRRYPTELAASVVVPVAGLAADDPDGGCVAERVAGGDPRPLLAAYLDLLVDWHVHLWLRHGIALEAHQQNVHLVLDPDGAVRLLYKDNDGARMTPRAAVALHDARMRVSDPGELADVFTTITLHLCAAAPLLDLAARGLAVPTPAAALRPRLLAARDRWGGPATGQRPDGTAAEDRSRAAALLTERVLDAATLPIKAMLTAGTLLPKERLGCTDINKYYLRTGPNYLADRR